jgi:hypothetical protein
MSELTIKKKSCLIVGLDNGSIYTLNFNNENKLQLINARNDHIKAVT